MNTDERKQPMFNFVPFARSRWIVTDGHFQAILIRKALEAALPQAGTTAIAATAIGRNQQSLGLWIGPLPGPPPPPLNALDRKLRRIVTPADIDESFVVPFVIDAVRNRWSF